MTARDDEKKKEDRRKAERIIADNRKAFHDYHLLETFEAGVALVGTEVKAIREGRVNLRDSFARGDGRRSVRAQRPHRLLQQPRLRRPRSVAATQAAAAPRTRSASSSARPWSAA